MSEEAGFLASVKETVKTVVYALLIAGIFRTLFFQPFWIPSGSMKDTLLIGDFLFVNKMAYGYSYASCPSIRIPAIGVDIGADDFCGVFEGSNERFMGSDPEPGDVVVFRHPVTGMDFIKRLIGTPGDRIQMINSVLHINNVPVTLEDGGTFEEVMEYQGPQRLRPRCENGAVGQGAICEKSRQFETKRPVAWALCRGLTSWGVRIGSCSRLRVRRCLRSGPGGAIVSLRRLNEAVRRAYCLCQTDRP